MHKPAARSPHATLRLGTRGSPLALAQAEMVKAALGGVGIEIVPVRTTGDRVQDRPLAEIGGKALWTKELDWALLRGDIDIAVHSMKDVESERPAELALAAALPRADPRDRLIGAGSLGDLNPAMRVGTTSPRRMAQIARRHPGIGFVPFRGNIGTRLARLQSGEADVTLLAAAGLDRLGHPGIGAAVEPEDMLPAPGQAIIGIETRANAESVRTRLAALSHMPTITALLAERAFAAALGGSCHSPVAAFAVEESDGFRLRGEILTGDGGRSRTGERRFEAVDAEAAGRDLAQELLMDAPTALRALFEAG